MLKPRTVPVTVTTVMRAPRVNPYPCESLVRCLPNIDVADRFPCGYGFCPGKNSYTLTHTCEKTHTKPVGIPLPLLFTRRRGQSSVFDPTLHSLFEEFTNKILSLVRYSTE